jgi:hypothetical protein
MHNDVARCDTHVAIGKDQAPVDGQRTNAYRRNVQTYRFPGRNRDIGSRLRNATTPRLRIGPRERPHANALPKQRARDERHENEQRY